MSRIAILALVAALLGLGLWAALGASSTPAATGLSANDLSADGSASEASAPSAQVGAADAETAPADGETAPADALSIEDRLAADGFAPVPFRSDEPVQRFDAPESVLVGGLDYRAVMETTAGTLLLDLYETRVPRTVDNLVFLALERFYEGVPFHRVIDGFMAQTGDPTGTGRGGPGYAFDDEIVDGLVHDRPGLLSMANAGPDTNGSQFFLTFAETPWLDGNHAIFGEVAYGLDVLDAITRVDPQNPSIVARLAEPASVLAEQGVDEAAGMDGTVEAFLLAELGELPAQGQTFRVVGRRGVFGSLSGAPAVGLFPVPDRIERVTIWTRPKEDSP